MKVATVLLRWYKSFNVNFMGYSDRRAGVVPRPWNLLVRDSGSETDFPFIEIPLEADITTVVGANESGKSHLLSAISKVLTGSGIPDGSGRGREFSRTDLCHYMSQRSKNADDWPNIGLQFANVTKDEALAIGQACGDTSIVATCQAAGSLLTLVLAPGPGDTVAYLFAGSVRVGLGAEQLAAVRKLLPAVEFIHSDIAIADQVSIATLIGAYDGRGGKGGAVDYESAAAQAAARCIASLGLEGGSSALAPEGLARLVESARALGQARVESTGAQLEAMLFRDVLGIDESTLRFVAELGLAARTYADGLASKWSREIEERLNLSHYWQQDDAFALGVRHKQGVLYFEITDKTGATYTFRERSSGLRYFLSYYIQAKALELISRTSSAIVLMDEPDSFLSILGQRNLLAVFESLVQAESSGQKCQLVYTTHSPFLVNRNFPQRLRLVRKGDAEEGTQLIGQAMLRRYEPVRSALGIDCAQTLFMGATNLVVEGPTDQLIISELVRRFAKPDNLSELLDLNSIVIVSAESAPSVEKILAASQWGNEPVPATVVLLDSDQEGNLIRDRVTGKARNCKELISPGFVFQIGDLLGTEDRPVSATTEDLFPAGLYASGVERYVRKWHTEVQEIEKLVSDLGSKEFGKGGIVADTRKALHTHVLKKPREYDKYGVLQEVIGIVAERPDDDVEIVSLRERFESACHSIRRGLVASQQAASRQSGKQAVQRLVDDFLIGRKVASSVYDTQLLLERLQRDAKNLGEDGENLEGALRKLLGECEKLRASGQRQFQGREWEAWKVCLIAIRNHPLGFKVKFIDGSPVPAVDQRSEAQAGSSDGATPDTESMSKD